MTKEELLKALKAIKIKQEKDPDDIYDRDEDHMQADAFLLEYINDSQITEAFESLEKWYA